MPQTYQGCKTIMSPARLWFGPVATPLGADCNDYYGYTLSGNYSNTATVFTLSGGQLDYTTIDKANNIVNLGYFTKNGEVYMANDKTLSSTDLATVDLVRGLSKLKDKICSCGSDTSFMHSQSATTNEMRFTAEWTDFAKEDPNTGWFSVDTLDAVEVTISTEYDEPYTNQQGTVDVVNGQRKITIKAKLPLTIEPKYMKGVVGGDPIVVDNAELLEVNKRYQALFTNMAGKSACHLGLCVVPESVALDCDAYDTDGNLKLNNVWFMPRVACKTNLNFQYNKGTQTVLDVEYTVLFDPYFQAQSFLDPLSHTAAHYPTLLP